MSEVRKWSEVLAQREAPPIEDPDEPPRTEQRPPQTLANMGYPHIKTLRTRRR